MLVPSRHCLQSCFSVSLIVTPSGRGAEYCDQFICVSVCPRAYLWNRWTDLHDFLCRSSVAVARSSYGGVAIRYVYFRLMDDVTFGRTAVVGCMAVRYDTGARIYKPCSSIAPVVNTDLSFDESKSQVHRCTLILYPNPNLLSANDRSLH